MAIKDYVVTQRHYFRLCLDYEPLTTCQAIELHDLNKG